MNPLFQEYLVEERRKDIRREMSNIRMEEEAMRGQVFRPSLFTRTMRTLGQWLIARGEQLVKRYETPEAGCQPAGQTYAHQ